MSDLELTTVLHDTFKLPDFRPGQRKVIDALLSGKSAAAVFPTGGGKSLCYQLPAVLLPGLTIVVSPLIALMKDQIDALAARGIPAERLDSTLDLNAYRRVMDDVRMGRMRLLYVAPERFNNERFRESIRRVRVSLFAVDEAHCISEWGHNFRPDYLKLPQYAKLCGAERMLALTATATDSVLSDICKAFEIDPACAVRTSFYRSNLTILTTATRPSERDIILLDQLRKRPRGPAIVYVTLQRTAEELSKRLTGDGFDARAYHAGMEDDDRSAVQDWFITCDAGIVVATIAFGMGIDKANIRYVYHYNPAKSLENFAQEIGRAGRDGQPAICQMFLCDQDLKVLENFAYGDTPSSAAVQSLVDDLFTQDESIDVSFYELSKEHDIRILVVRTLLAYLELQGYIEGGTPYYASYSFKALKPSAAILSRFEGERREFLTQVFRQAKRGRTWLRIDVEQAARVIQCDRQRIIAALDYLHEQHLLEVKAEGVRLRYKRLRVPQNRRQLGQELHAALLKREKREIERLQQVVSLVKHPGCQVAMLGGHFGEQHSEPCGHCTWCLQVAQTADDLSKATDLADAGAISIDENIWSQVIALRRSHPKALTDAAAVARLLCGLTSPHLSRAKLNKHALFGVLSDVPYQNIVEHAQVQVF